MCVYVRVALPFDHREQKPRVFLDCEGGELLRATVPVSALLLFMAEEEGGCQLLY